MTVRLLTRSLWRRKTRTALMLVSVATAAALVAGFLNIAFQISERMAKEMRSFGANIVVVPRAEPLEVEIGGLKYVSPGEATYLEEADLPKLKTIFWRHNIVAFAPFLSRVVEVEGRQALLVGTWFEKEIPLPEGKRVFTFASGSRREVAAEKGKVRTGLKTVAPWWKVEGRWISEDEGGAMVGRSLARRLNVGIGDPVRLSYEGKTAQLAVRGVIETGGVEEEQIFAHLRLVQELFGLPGKVERVQVSALVTPDNALAVRANRIGPAKLPPEEYETWYCTPYINSIIYQIEEAIPDAKGKAIRQVSEAEGTFLKRMSLAFSLTIAVALLVACLGVMATMVTAIFERRQEIGLMKALGAEGKRISFIFLLEGGVVGVAGGVLGYFGGLILAHFLVSRTFALTSSAISLSLQGVIFFLTLILALSVALLGSLFPVRRAAGLEPVRTLRGD